MELSTGKMVFGNFFHVNETSSGNILGQDEWHFISNSILPLPIRGIVLNSLYIKLMKLHNSSDSRRRRNNNREESTNIFYFFLINKISFQIPQKISFIFLHSFFRFKPFFPFYLLLFSSFINAPLLPLCAKGAKAD